MSYVIAMNSSYSTISYYKKRLSTTRNGVKGSYPIFVDDVDKAHQFDTFNRADASLKKLLDFYSDSKHNIRLSIVDLSELVEDDQVEEDVLEQFEFKIEDLDDVEDLNDREEYRITKDSVLSNAYLSNFSVADEEGYVIDAFSAHQAYHYLIADHVDRKRAELGKEHLMLNFDIFAADTNEEVSEYASQLPIEDVDDFDKLRQLTMFRVLYHRYFQDEEFKKALLATGDKRLVVLSKNNFWGDNYGRGHNILGRLLEQLRKSGQQ